jgi:hypothetical protein
MPRIEDISYSRQATVAAIRDYYRFLVSMYLNPTDVQEPPEGGWPSIPLNGWKNFDKTDEVIGLLRELPYLRDRSAPFGLHGAAFTVFADWQWTPENIDGQVLKEWSEPDSDEATIPAHIVGLTVPNDRNLSPAFLLDTELGVIYSYECHGKIKSLEFSEIEGDSYDWGDDGLIPEDQVDWRANSGVWAIEMFFEMLKDHFQKLNFVPTSPHEVGDMWAGREDYGRETLRKAQMVYRKHGWPDVTRFNKQECAAEVETLVNEREAEYQIVLNVLMQSLAEQVA